MGIHESNTSFPVISYSYQWIWMGFDMLLRLVGLMNVILTLFHLIDIQGKESNLGDLVNKTTTKITLTYIQTFTDQFLSNLVWWYTPLNLYSLITMQITWPPFKVTGAIVIRGSRYLCTHFLHNFCNQFEWNLVCCHDMLVCFSPC